MGKIRFLFIAAVSYLFIKLKKHTNSLGLSLFISWMWLMWIAMNYAVRNEVKIGNGMISILQSNSVMLPLCSTAVVILAWEICKVAKEKVGTWIMWFGVIEAAHCWMQMLGVPTFVNPKEPWFINMPLGTQGQPTFLGPFLVACLAPALWKKKYELCLFMLVPIIGTLSTMTYASLACLLFLYSLTLFNKKTLIMGYSVAAIILTLFAFNYKKSEFLSTNYRIPVWGLALKNISIFGGGPDYWTGTVSFSKEAKAATWNGLRPERIHSEPLEVLVDFGWVGFLICLYALYEFFRRFKLSWEHATVCSILVNSLANFPLHIVSISVLFMISLVYSMQYNSEGDKNE